MKLGCFAQERLAAEEWLAVATSMLGTLGLGVSAEEPTQKQEAGSIGVMRVLRLGLCFLVLGALILYGSRMTSPVRRKSSGGSGGAASIHGLQVTCKEFCLAHVFGQLRGKPDGSWKAR